MEFDFEERARRFREARKNMSESMREVEEASDVRRSTIFKLEKADDDTNVGYQDIVRLADHYKVNVAWLMQQPGSSAPLDENIQNAIRVTGLSSEAVEQLCSLGGREIACLNALLSSYDFRKALFMLSKAKQISQRIETWKPIVDPDGPQTADEYADIIEKANFFEIDYDHKNDKEAWFPIGTGNNASDRQLVQMYRYQGLQHMGNAFIEYAPAEESERKGK